MTEPHPDFEWLGLDPEGDGHFGFTLVDPISRPDGRFYGGTGVAVTVATMEAVTGRQALYVTVQYAASADLGERFDVHTEVLAAGRRTSQLRVTGSVGDRVVFAAVGATGELRDGKLEAQFGAMPAVPGPEDSPPWEPPKTPFRSPARTTGFPGVGEIREVADGIAPDRMALWARMRKRPQSRATLGFLSDVVPMGVMRAAGRAGGGTSLDNAMRFGPTPDSDWVLLDLDPHLASGGYLHGAGRVWAEDGVLLAVASQSAIAFFRD